MKIAFLLYLLPSGVAFSSSASFARTGKSTVALHLTSQNEACSFSRREAIQAGFVTAASLGSSFLVPNVAMAEGEETKASVIKNVVVAGATGQTGSRVFERLVAQNFDTTGGVRNVAKASKSLKGNLKQLDVVEDSLESLTETLKGAGTYCIHGHQTVSQ